MQAVPLEGPCHGFTDQVGVVVRYAVFVAVDRHVNVPCHGKVLDVVEGIGGAAGVHDAGFVSHACEGSSLNDGRRVQDQHFQHFTGVGTVVVGDVVHKLVRAASVPRNGQVVTDDIAVIVGTSEVVGVHAGVDIPTPNKGVKVGRRVGGRSRNADRLAFGNGEHGRNWFNGWWDILYANPSFFHAT